MTPDRWRTGNTRPHTVWRDLGGVGHDERLGVFDDPEDARRAVDAVNAQAADTQRAAPTLDADPRSFSLDEPATSRLGDVPTTLRWVKAVIEADLSMADDHQVADEHRTLLRRISGAEVAVYAALRGAGADGGGEHEARQQRIAGSMARAEVAGIKAVLRDRDVVRDADDSLADTVAQALDRRTRNLARLASAAGVDPDAADPVGEIERVIREGREVEVVSGDEVATLPRGTRIVAVDHEHRPRLPAGVFEVNHGVGPRTFSPDVRFLVYRAPAPTPAPLAVGEVVRGGGDLQRLPLGSIVESVEFGAIDKRTDPTCWALPGSIFPVRVVRVGTGGGESS